MPPVRIVVAQAPVETLIRVPLENTLPTEFDPVVSVVVMAVLPEKLGVTTRLGITLNTAR